MKRRNFIKTSSLASTALMVPTFLQSPLKHQPIKSRTGKILIVIQLSGGNDGLNTVIPYQNDIYYNQRPRLAIQPDNVLKLNDELGFNPALSSLRDLFEDGLVSIINEVGYPNPDRSHFRSMDIWHTASGSEEYWTSGWLGRYLDSNCDQCKDPHHALEVDDSLSLALKGNIQKGFAVSNPTQLKRMTQNKFLQFAANQFDEQHREKNVQYLYKTMINTQSSASYLYEKSQLHRSSTTYPTGFFGKSLKQIAELITADTSTKIYYTSLTGFDTHANQPGVQARLLQQYADGVKALVSDLKHNGLLKDTLIMTFSEFGRRVKQNASNGTDHGTANNLFIIGEDLPKPGFFNSAPNLIDLDNGDLKFKVDFRQIYATILDKWLDTAANKVLKQQFAALPFIS